ncbi:MAG: sterol desaturase family protein [Vicinamibacterales bacterium]
MGTTVRNGLVLGAAAVVWWLERRWRARRYRSASRPVHISRNLATAALAAVTVQVAELPLLLPLAGLTAARSWGLTARLPVPGWTRAVLACLLLDYTLYVWHILSHRVPWLWRFHLFHHADLDLDASTGLRFHPGELVLSIPWRGLQIVLIGVTPAVLLTWQSLTLACVLFHHANVALPAGAERLVRLVLASPRMHAIHHSVHAVQMQSNYSSGLSWWDRLHGTLRLDADAADVTTGIAEYQDPDGQHLAPMLALPFGRQLPLPPG